ncbi:FkbM family methyltransferase [Tabrizicola sp. TH137]|uniref:FkbM family methyltransferase n=1 Tax=Tabrizicola sp. TH137 TaxID=2067452 RepID=UPI000C79D75E|nr:FkbM family methyltransferase [Tabrizicola sp. TH137]PLL14448.1 FkbM family methyltransferase [Tabrizicola sp. TH137]
MRQLLRSILMLVPTVLLGTLRLYSLALSKLTGRDFAMMVRERIMDEAVAQKQTASHVNGSGSSVDLIIHTPNSMCKMRADTFSTKEPEILRWIDSRGGAGTFWDIGANVGLYSLYYAKTHPGRVVCFEPSVFNLRQLAKNISVNGLSQKIDVVPFALSDRQGFQSFRLSSETEGGALNAFGVDYGFDGKKIASLVEYRTFGMSADQLVSLSLIEGIPSMIKIDVDGIEHLILSGMTTVLAHPDCQSVYVEVNEGFSEQADQVNDVLGRSGFRLVERTREEFTSNQIWVK